MKHQRIAFIAIWLTAFLWISLQELSLLPQGFLPMSAGGEYAANLFCFITAVGGTYLACRLFAFQRVKAELYAAGARSTLPAHRRWNNRRLVILAIAIFPSLFLYYAGSFSPTALYSALLALAGSLLCWPTYVDEKAINENAQSEEEKDN